MLKYLNIIYNEIRKSAVFCKVVHFTIYELTSKVSSNTHRSIQLSHEEEIKLAQELKQELLSIGYDVIVKDIMSNLIMGRNKEIIITISW